MHASGDGNGDIKTRPDPLPCLQTSDY